MRPFRTYMNDRTKPHRSYYYAQDTAALPRIEHLVAAHLIYGYRPITGMLNRVITAEDFALVNHKRVYRIVKKQIAAGGIWLRPTRAHSLWQGDHKGGELMLGLDKLELDRRCHSGGFIHRRS